MWLRRNFASLRAAYTALVSKGTIKEDPKQLQVLAHMERIQTSVVRPDERVVERIVTKAGRWFQSETVQERTTIVRSRTQGLYVYGAPGCGKTFLMDLFFDAVEIKEKRRTHFNKFMLETHRYIHELSKTLDLVNTPRAHLAGFDPVTEVANALADEIKLLCFDEFQVTDIADAMILKRLFETFWKRRVCVVATSNRPPDDLYYNGLQRDLFLPFIPLLKENCDVVSIGGDVDYRYGGTGEEYRCWISPMDDLSLEEAKQAYQKLTGERTGEVVTVPVMQGRTLTCRNALKGVAWFSFSELCERALGAADYIALSQHFHHVILTGVPEFTIADRDLMRRFILLIDELYNRKVKLCCTASTGVNSLFRGKTSEFDEVFAFDRTVSRLNEMQTKEYRELPHLPDL
jgi:predicted ATPase